MKELIYPSAATIVSAIVFALANLFGSVQHNTQFINQFKETLKTHRNFVLQNHDSIIRLQEYNKNTTECIKR